MIKKEDLSQIQPGSYILFKISGVPYPAFAWVKVEAVQEYQDRLDKPILRILLEGASDPDEWININKLDRESWGCIRCVKLEPPWREDSIQLVGSNQRIVPELAAESGKNLEATAGQKPIKRNRKNGEEG